MSNPAAIYASGQRVYLRALTLEDTEGPWHDWFNDEEVARYTNHWQTNTVKQQKSFFETRVENSGDLVLAVVACDGDRHIGVTSLSGIDWVHRFASVALIIGDREARKEAVLGLEAFTLILKAGFLRLNLENLKGGYVEGQKHSEHILKTMRFREVGRMKGLYFIDGQRQDQVLVQLSRDEWLKRNPIDRAID